MIDLALRNLFRHRGRTYTTLGAIVFGVAGLILTGGFVHDVFLQLGEALIHSQTGHLQVLPAGYHQAGRRLPEQFRIDKPGPIMKDIAALPEVADVMARVAFSGLINNGRSDWSVVGEGVQPDSEARLGTYVRMVAGRRLGNGDPNGVEIGEGVAQALNLVPGDRATIIVNTAEGALNSTDVEVVGVFQSFSKDFDNRALRIPLATAQDLLLTNAVNGVVVSLKETSDTDLVADRVKAAIAGQPLEVRTWRELNDFYEKTVALYDRQFGVLRLIVLAMVLLSVANTVNMTVFERVGEFGTMRALGNRKRSIVLLIFIESSLLGLIGSTLGVALGTASALAISAVGIPMPPPPNANLGYTALIRIIPEIVLIAFLIGCVATALAAVLPATRVSRQPLADALRANV